MKDADYADDLALLTNILAQAEFLQHSWEQAARGIDFYISANKIEFMGFKREGTMSILSDSLLKLVDQLINLGSNILSTESDVNIRLVKA